MVRRAPFVLSSVATGGVAQTHRHDGATGTEEGGDSEAGQQVVATVGAEPPVMAGEVAGAVTERDLLSAVFEGRANLADPVSAHMGDPFPLIGSGEPVSAATKALGDCDALLVVEDGKPIGVITRHDLLAFVSSHPIVG